MQQIKIKNEFRNRGKIIVKFNHNSIVDKMHEKMICYTNAFIQFMGTREQDVCRMGLGYANCERREQQQM